MRRIRKTRIFVAVFLVICGYTPFIVQAQPKDCPESRPSEDELTRIRNAGRWLALYDIVCSRANDALTNQGHSVDGSPCLAKQRNGGWSVGYGNWSNDSFNQKARVYLNSAREVTDVEDEESTLDQGWLYRFGRAASISEQKAGDELGELAEEYRYGVIVANYPWDDGVLTTYVFPDPENETSLGGDLRVEIDANTGSILESERLHNEVIPMSQPPGNAEASVSTAVQTCLPTETDVFMVLRRESSLPHTVVAEEWIYGIEPNGEVKVLRRREK